jgi:predicted ribosome quality control (RQC) complex YloA/Tae2 family protein
MNSMTVYALGSELDRALSGATIRRVTRYVGAVTITLDGASIRHLHLLHHRREPELIATPEELAPGSLGAQELGALAGRRIAGVETLGLERVLVVKVASGDEWGQSEELLLRIDLTPAYKPLSLFAAQTGRLLATIGDRRARKPLKPFEALPERSLSILSLPERMPEGLLEVAAKDDAARRTKAQHLAAVLSQKIGGLDPVVAGAVARAAGGDIGKIWAAVIELGRRFGEKRWDWRIYAFPEEREPYALYPIELPLDASSRLAKDFVEALEMRARDAAIPDYVDYLSRKAASRVAKERKRLERLSANLAQDLEDAGRSDEYRHWAELLVTHRHLLKNGMKSAVLRDFSGDRDMTVPLDPRRSIEANIRSYYMKAKKGEKGGLIIRNRKRSVDRSIAEQEASIVRIGRMAEPAELLAIIPREGPARPVRREPEAPERFKRFQIDERHTVYVGRSDEENDILTHKFASPSDLWFHAQGVPGSHVVLKGAHRSTPRSIIETAASIAAYFSKARHSKTVPVIYTEKRHVRKPRKAKPGTATCTHEKTLFVTPELPEERKPG